MEIYNVRARTHNIDYSIHKADYIKLANGYQSPSKNYTVYDNFFFIHFLVTSLSNIERARKAYLLERLT